MSTYHGRDHGSKIGMGGMASGDLLNLQRKERLKAVVADVYDLKSDPYLFTNHVGLPECRLCGTVHRDESNYVEHTKGKRHQEQLAKRQHKIKKEKQVATAIAQKREAQRPRAPRVGRPAYRIIKLVDRTNFSHGLLFRLEYPEIAEDQRPRFRFMSSFEQHIEPTNDKFQYILFAAEPYEVVAFKIPNLDIDRAPDRFLTHWNEETNVFTLQMFFKDVAKELKQAVLSEKAANAAKAELTETDNTDVMGV